MLWLLGSVILSSWLVILFRLFSQKSVHLVSVITINYVVCVVTGWWYGVQGNKGLWALPLGVYGLGIIQGFLFIFMFFQIAVASQTIGLGYTALFSRLSVIIPVGVSVLVFYEQITFWQFIGLIFASLAIYFLTSSSFSFSGSNRAFLKQALILFLGNGAIDTVFKVFSYFYGVSVPQEAFIMLVFGTAALLGGVYLLMHPAPWKPQTLIAGILLGVPNFFSLIFLLNGLKALGGAKFFPLNNIGIILLLTFVGILLFKEKMYPKMSLGFIFTIIAIVLISEWIY